jgi:putative spermidine/putrescine transport system ATP-binding protein
LQRQLGLTTVMVTHDQEEALTVADRLVVMSEGEVRQIGTQRDLYERPADRFVAGFVGRSTFIEGDVDGQGVFATSGGLRLRCDAGAVRGPAAMALRPERVGLGSAPLGLDNDLPGTVEFVSYLGAALDLRVRLSDTDRVTVQLANRQDGSAPAVGERVHVGWSAGVGRIFTRDVAKPT